MMPAARTLAAAACVLALLAHVEDTAAATATQPLTPEIESALEKATYVYIATNRKDGSYSSPAEIWFMYLDGAVWVASPTTTWRVRRIRAGRPRAKIAVGSINGPTFDATGSIVTDPARYQDMFRIFASKYPGGWPKYEERFRSGLADGTRVLIRYQPVK